MTAVHDRGRGDASLARRGADRWTHVMVVGGTLAEWAGLQRRRLGRSGSDELGSCVRPMPARRG